ncbi:MAG: hypothetical protein HN558_07135 [Gemmatimonadetes bacterium]|jgi:hypothetical protein|nr:hypothetical protein [Gemmatimonadota bacterium]MDE0966192.1 hypothetical protein [Candidatus Latescibacterota bacterium]
MFLAQEVWVELFDRDPDVGIRMQTGLIKDLYARIHAINAELRKLRDSSRTANCLRCFAVLDWSRLENLKGNQLCP